MKKVLFSLFFCFSSSVNLCAIDIKLTESNNQFQITSKTLSEMTFVNHLSELTTKRIKKDNNEFFKLHVNGYGDNAEYGNASLPVLEDLLIVPFGSEILIEIINKEEKIIRLDDHGIIDFLFPCQPSISKSDNVDDVPFYFNNQYYEYNDFHISNVVKTEVLGKMRGQQLARISISPFEYNPTSNELKIITSLEVKITFKDIDLEAHNLNKVKYYSPEFENLYKTCLNYIPTNQKDIITTYPTKYVIISDPAFQAALQPLVDWKTRKGFIVVEGYTDDPNVGTTTSSIHAYIKNMYDNPVDGIPPTYLLIVGDDAQIPSFSGNTGSHLSDMYYCEFDGAGDFYPEMYYGRFSATNPGDVESQVSKTLTHERYMFSDPSFLDEVVLVAGVDASMAPTYGNGQINYGTDNYFNVAHGLTIHNYLYGSGTPITSDMSSASSAIISDISAGVGFANYTAHCGSYGWSDPAFENSDISGLQNYDQYGLLIGNCCQSNKFDAPACFGEAILRVNDKGAVGYIGGSNNTYWDEDYWWAVGNTSNFTANPTYAGTGLAAYDCLMHENGEQKEDWFITAGQMIHSGNLAVTEAGGSEEYYWEIYHLMGDPSLMPYIGVPTPLTASHAAATPVGTSSLTINTEENAYVAISVSGVLLDAQLADASGIVNLSFNPISNVGIADIVITKQFKQPYEGTIQIISPTGPYVIYSSNTIDDSAGNNNQLVDYDELISMHVSIQNVGAIDATSVNVVISTPDPNINLINNSDIINVISSQQIISINNPFTFQVADDVSDQHIVDFDLTMTDNQGNSWTSTISITINSPVLDHTTFVIDDGINGNGRLDAGETLDIILDVTNIGHADIGSLIANFSTLSNYVTVNNTTYNVTSLSVNGQQSTVFNVTIDPNTPMGTIASFSYDVSNGNYSHNTMFNEIIGEINEDFETADFTKYEWIDDPQFPWVIDNSNVYEGASSAKSYPSLPNGEVSHLKIDSVDVIAPGDVSFYKFVSSEQDYDFLQFYIDGNKQGEWSGIDNSWSFVSFPVSVGIHEFEWEYDKDQYVTGGQDCAWLDYIVFPPINIGQTTNIDEENFDFKIYPNPTIGVFSVEFNDSKIHTVEVYNSNGKRLSRINDQKNSTVIDIDQYKSGVYTIKIMPEAVIYQIIKQ